MTTVKLTACQEKGLELLLESQDNVFLTGAPGTGKSFLISEYLKREIYDVPVIASTGAAAILVGGRTFHSFFGLGIMQGSKEMVIEKALKDKRLKARLKKVMAIIIDEVSMLSIDALDCAERIAKGVSKSERPWGGLRVIAVGDFAQLPPISDNNNYKEWCFLSEAWAKSRFKTIELKEVKRTEDAEYLKILEDIRWGQTSERVINFLNERVDEGKKISHDVPHIFPRRAQTDAFNSSRLAEIKHPLKKFETEYGGEGFYLDKMKRESPIPPILELKKDALVMLRVNDPKQRFVNGTIGRVLQTSDEKLILDIDGRDVEIDRFTFVMMNADGHEVAFAINFPVTLAYASTIHKIQGTTLDRAHVSLSGLWEPGQAYVALSRTRTVKGITIMDWDSRSIKADPTVRSFYNKVVAQNVP
jgi:ATP-dependent DNA helicase PIF1